VHVRNSLVDIYRQGQLNNLPPDQSQPFVMNASLDYFGSLSPGATLDFKLTTLDNSTTIASGPLGGVNSTDSAISGMATIPSEDVELWWPVGMGKQNLYYVTVDLLSANKTQLATITKRVGFRTIVLNSNPISDEQLAQGKIPQSRCLMTGESPLGYIQYVPRR
jgi:beta-mannosidase